MNKRTSASWVAPVVLIALVVGTGYVAWVSDLRPRTASQLASGNKPVGTEKEGAAEAGPEDEQEPKVPTPVNVTLQETLSTPADATALGGYDVLIADRGNNRIIEVSPDKKIVWEYDFNLPQPGLGADDAFFTDGGKHIIANLEEYHVIQLLDYDTKTVLWQYGVPGKPGSGDGSLHTPDDSYMLPNGDVIVADIKNCRVIEIAPDKKIVRQYGVTKKCGAAKGLLDKPNGDTPLKNGHILVSNIVGHNLIELDENWAPVFSMNLPVRYPSDPQPTKAGNILISDFSDPGQVVEVAKDGTVVWALNEKSGPTKLNHPSLAVELPNGNIMANDDDNQRVIVIDKKTKQIVWQYGVSGKPGKSPGQLNDPDGMDIIMRTAAPAQPVPAAPADLKTTTVGAVTRHAAGFVGKVVSVDGLMRKSEGDYIIVSDEAVGALGVHDLPVAGAGISSVLPDRHYAFTGTFIKTDHPASNGSLYRLELTQPPVPLAAPAK